MQLSKSMTFALLTLAFGATLANACPNQTPGSTTDKSPAGKKQTVSELLGQRGSSKQVITSSDTAN